MSNFALPTDRSVALMIRHAARYPIYPKVSGEDVLLTPQGIVDAENFGRELGSRIEQIRSSPVKRCLQTSEAILRGAGLNLPIEHDILLGDPGIFVRDIKDAWQYWIQHDDLDILFQKFLEGQTLPGIYDIKTTSQKLLQVIIPPQDHRGIFLWVTHDTILGPFVSSILPNRLTVKDWPGFLEVAAFWREDNLIHCQYKNFSANMPIS